MKRAKARQTKALSAAEAGRSCWPLAREMLFIPPAVDPCQSEWGQVLLALGTLLHPQEAPLRVRITPAFLISGPAAASFGV